jgi:cytoplasmic iron level regulating protein YaaA (DUF328/UPF0246 family)
MIFVLSPAKSLNETPSKIKNHSDLVFAKESLKLVKQLKTLDQKKLAKLMHISDGLAEVNHNRYQNFKSKFSTSNSLHAIHIFAGDVYTGLDAESFGANDLKFAQKSLRILSGLYGLIKPLDLIQPYRLEMGTLLSNGHGKNLYDFWDTKITEQLNVELEEYKASHLLNLASVEYFKSVKRDLLNKPVIDVDFKEYRDDKLRVISFTAKKARGDMARQIIKNRIKNPEDLKGLDILGYKYMEEGSSNQKYLFVK